MTLSRLIASVSLLAFATPAVAQQPASGLAAAVGRLMTTRPEFPKGFGPPAPAAQPRVVRQGLFSYSPPIREVVGPSGDRLAGTSAAGDLYVRDAGSEQPRIVARADGPWRWDIEGAAWSPDGRRLAVKRVDDHEVPRIPIVDWTAAHEAVRLAPYSRVGDPLPREQVLIVDVASGQATAVHDASDDPYIHVLGWRADGRSLRLVRADRLLKHVDLLDADAATGTVRRILRDSSDTFVVGLPLLDGYDDQLRQLHLAWFLDASGQFLWTSERSGTRRIYLYRADGTLIRPLTDRLAGPVHRIVGLDERRGRVYFTASADPQHPYRQQLYRVSLDGGDPREVTDAGTSPRVAFTPSMDSVAVARMALPDLAEVDVVDADGRSRRVAWKEDLGFLEATGFAPEIAWSLAADGKTRLRTLLLKPDGFDPSRRYPVVELIYGSPNERMIPDLLQSGPLWVAQQLANDGFVIVMTDGRGTPGRGKAFEDFAYGRIGQVELADHAAVLRELARDRPYMDLSRVGVLGHSWGGYFALRAALLEPELYKAAVVSAGALDLPGFRVSIEPYMGCLPAGCPEAYAKGRNTPLIAGLKGRVMIAHGTADDDVPFADAMQLVQALERAGKNFDLVVYPGADHILPRLPDWEHRASLFFQRELSDEGPRG